MPFLVAFLLLAPLLPLLAHFPQSPDGAEMVTTALYGGVLHPSGIPLQAWINHWAVQFLPLSPGYVLSVMSWLGGLGTVLFLFLTIRRLGLSLWVAIGACAAYAYVPVVMLMNLTPEKYSWLTLTQMFFVYQLTTMIVRRDSSLRAMLILSLAMGLALAQHSANVILLPPYLYLVARGILTAAKKQRWNTFKNGLLSIALMSVVTSGFYISLLWLRASHPWPDWGQLETLKDVWNHVVRQDYGFVQLHHREAPHVASVSAVKLLFEGLLTWTGAFLLVPLGIYAGVLKNSSRLFVAFTLMIVFPGLAVLAMTNMPTYDLNTVMGYQERYPILLLPIFSLFWALGLAYVLEAFPRYRAVIGGVVVALLVFFAVQGLRQHLKTDNNLVDIYREQAKSEFDLHGLFWTGSDFTAFYGIPMDNGLVFPLKGLLGMKWYREQVVPKMAPPLSRILRDPLSPPRNIEELFRRALQEGFKITLTEPTRFLNQADILNSAEQTGVLWNFSAANSTLYTDRIVASAVNLCGLFPKAWHGLPEKGLWFVREYLSSFHYVFLSASDHHQNQSQPELSAAARQVAEILVPGREPAEWIEKCRGYTERLKN